MLSFVVFGPKVRKDQISCLRKNGTKNHYKKIGKVIDSSSAPGAWLICVVLLGVGIAGDLGEVLKLPNAYVYEKIEIEGRIDKLVYGSDETTQMYVLP